MEDPFPLTPTEKQYLRLIRRLAKAGRSPCIGDVVKKSPRGRTAVAQAIARLQRAGVLRLSNFRPGCPRFIELL